MNSIPSAPSVQSLPLVPVVLCGGAGARLWPLSRKNHPKQFAPLFSAGETLFRRAMARAARFNPRHSIVVCNAAHRFFAAAGLSESERDACTVIAEPQQRGTAPAATLAALEARRQFDDALLLIMPSDHIIADAEAFAAAVDAAKAAAAAGKIVLFGVPPRGVETEYGHIRLKQPRPADAQPGAPLEVAAFHEKPDRQTAADYLARGDVCWNSGVFLCRASIYLRAIKAFEPGILDACERALAKRADEAGVIEPGAESFAACRAISIDRAVIERADNLAVVTADMNWSDVGGWNRLAEAGDFSVDANGNRVRGAAVCRDAARNIVHAGERLVAVLGVDDCIIADTADALLVARAERAADITDLVDDLRARGRAEADQPRRVRRPWGYYQSVDRGDNFQVKRIVVNPRMSLSLQLHHRRSEHWTVVAGKARVTVGDKVFELSANQSTYIPPETRHRLENPGDAPVVFIEVQCGDYLGEDDIVRFDDRYGRTSGD